MNDILEKIKFIQQQLERLKTGGLSSRHLAKKRSELEEKIKELREQLETVS